MNKHDQYIQQKINDLGDEDLSIDKENLWLKLESNLDKKEKKTVLVWWRFASAACLVFGISLVGFWLKNKPVSSMNQKVVTSINHARNEVKRIYSNKIMKDSAKNERQYLAMSQAKQGFNNHQNIRLDSSQIKINIVEVQAENVKVLQTENDAVIVPEISTETVATIQKLSNQQVVILPKKQRLRVMNISEYRGDQPKIITQKSSKFSVSFGDKTQIQHFDEQSKLISINFGNHKKN